MKSGNYKHYEIICSVGVIGVCCVNQDNPEDDNLLHCATEDRVLAFGEITEEQFDKFGDDGWEQPISIIRWRPEIKRVCVLHPVEIK